MGFPAKYAALCAAMVMSPLPVLAGPAECAAIANSFMALANQHGYRQVVEMPKLKMRIEQIMLGNTLYTSTDGTWSKLTLKPGGRKDLAAQTLSETSISDCADAGSDALPDGRANVFTFTLAPPKSMPGTNPTRQKLWISTGDGLARRMVSDEMTINLSFEALKPPIP